MRFHSNTNLDVGIDDVDHATTGFHQSVLHRFGVGELARVPRHVSETRSGFMHPKRAFNLDTNININVRIFLSIS